MSRAEQLQQIFDEWKPLFSYRSSDDNGETLNMENTGYEMIDPFVWRVESISLTVIKARGSKLKELPELPLIHCHPIAVPGRDAKGKKVYTFKGKPANQIYPWDPMICVKEIDVSNTPIEKLPRLPCGLEVLIAEDCPNLKELPRLPKTLKKLSVNGCANLKVIPKLPEGLTDLDVSGCPIRVLPLLPKSLTYLDVSTCEKLLVPRKVLKEEGVGVLYPMMMQDWFVPVVEEDLEIFDLDLHNAEDEEDDDVTSVEDKIWEPLEEYKERSNALWHTYHHTRRMKERLVATVFHPSRVEKWLESGGYDLLDMMF